MPFHNELSNEIAIALMTRGDQSTADLKKLKDVVLTVHETLRQLEAQAARRRRNYQEAPATANDQRNNG
ncbi:MAG TPA: hypothetical protein VNG71_03360 [Pyrinomonadaceae bacterium]|nr:hypothetical protein [Pyrinomonadaceae bacterium]